jgi:hypothetical protein
LSTTALVPDLSIWLEEKEALDVVCFFV